MDRRADEGDVGVAGSSAGGKLTKRPFRPRPTPYARPPGEDVREQQRKKADGWLSKLLVQPAARAFPSLFSSAKHQGPPPSESLPENEQEDCDGSSALKSDDQFLESEEPGASAETGQPKVGSKGDELIGNKEGDTNGGSDLAKIEQRLKHKMFSRDESNRLIELLRSRTIDLPIDNGHAAGFIVKAAEVTLGQKDARKPAKKDIVGHRISEPPQLTARDVSSSPIDIAKSYMEARKVASEYDCHSGRSQNEQKKLINDDSSTSAVKSSVCWPGAIVQGNHGYFTPQTQGGRTGLRNFPRTPYSGSLFSRSTSKLQGGGERTNLPSAGWNQSYTPVFGGNSVKRRSSVLDDGFTSVKPIHHVRQKNMATTSSQGAGSSNPASSFSLLSNSPDGSKGISSTSQENLGQGLSKGSYRKFDSTHEDDEASRFTVGSTSVHPQSAKMARRILEHLDRPVFPKEKSQELELVFARTKVPPKSDAPSLGGPDKRLNVSSSDDIKTGCLLTVDMGAQKSVDMQKVFLVQSTSKSRDKDQLSFLPPQTGKPGPSGLAFGAAGFKSFQAPDSLPKSESLISATQPSGKAKSSDNGFSFSFPTPVFGNAIYEPPPTPTMNSSLAAGRTVHTNDETIPSFTFGSSNAGGRLVFSFAGESPAITEAAAPKFKFGSEGKRDLSFKLADNNAICY